MCCKHDPFEGRCVHCDVAFVDGRPCDDAAVQVAWRQVKQWLADYEEEERAFSRYRDDVTLDGVMTAGERRSLSAALAGVNDDMLEALQALLDDLHVYHNETGKGEDVVSEESFNAALAAVAKAEA